MTYEEVMDAIREMYGDTSVSIETTRENLMGLLDEIQVMLESLPESDE